MDCCPPVSSGHGISQGRTVWWVGISFSRGSSWPRDGTHISCTADSFFTWATGEAKTPPVFESRLNIKGRCNTLPVPPGHRSTSALYFLCPGLSTSQSSAAEPRPICIPCYVLSESSPPNYSCEAWLYYGAFLLRPQGGMSAGSELGKQGAHTVSAWSWLSATQH